VFQDDADALCVCVCACVSVCVRARTHNKPRTSRSQWCWRMIAARCAEGAVVPVRRHPEVLLRHKRPYQRNMRESESQSVCVCVCVYATNGLAQEMCVCVCVRVFTPQTALPRKCVGGWVGGCGWVVVYVRVCVCARARAPQTALHRNNDTFHI